MNKLQVIENFCYKIQQKSVEPKQRITIVLDKQHDDDILKDIQEKFAVTIKPFLTNGKNGYMYCTESGVEIGIQVNLI